MKNLFFLFVLVVVQACSVGKSPDWVANTPSSPTFYIGIGVAPKKDANYKQIALQNALNNLSNSISVNISVVSVFSQNESNKGFTEEFNEVTRVQTMNYIEGYKVLDSWQDKENYWVYINIEKVAFHNNRERKKKEVIDQAYDLYKTATAQDQNNQIQLALLNYVRALQFLSPFLTDNIVVVNGEENIYLANELINKISAFYKQLSLKAEKQDLTTEGGAALNNVRLISYRGSAQIPYVPIKLDSEDTKILGTNHQSDNQGIYSFSTAQFNAPNKSNYIVSCQVNFCELLEEATKDKLVLSLFANLQPNTFNLNIANKTGPISPFGSMQSRFEELSANNQPGFNSQQVLFSQGVSSEGTFGGSYDQLPKVATHSELLEALKLKTWFQQVDIIKFNAPNIQITVDQLADLLEEVPFDDYKIQIIEIYLPYLKDKSPKMYKTLAKKIDFDKGKNSLKKILDAHFGTSGN